MYNIDELMDNVMAKSFKIMLRGHFLLLEFHNRLTKSVIDKVVSLNEFIKLGPPCLIDG